MFTMLKLCCINLIFQVKSKYFCSIRYNTKLFRHQLIMKVSTIELQNWNNLKVKKIFFLLLNNNLLHNSSVLCILPT